MSATDPAPGIVFLPISGFPSGGVARSCADAKWSARSSINDSNDKKPPTERDAARPHYFDGTGYFAYLIQEKRGRVSNKEDDEQMQEMLRKSTARMSSRSTFRML